MVQPGKIILLHGASSSGKSTLARGLQARLDEPFWDISIDHLRDAGVLPSARFKSGEFDWKVARQPFFDGFHHSLAAYAAAGNNLIVTHVLDTEGWLADLVRLWAPFDVFAVGVHAPLALLNERERRRGDRQIGSAEQDFHTIHTGMRYDFEVHTDGNAEENVRRIIAAWQRRVAPSVFAELAKA